MEGGCSQEANQRESLLRSGSDTSTLSKIIYCMEFLSCIMCSAMLMLKVFLILKVTYNGGQKSFERLWKTFLPHP